MMWYIAGRIVTRIFRRYIEGGRRTSRHLSKLGKLSAYWVLFILVTHILSIVLTLLWSFTGRWQYPDLLPSSYTTAYWTNIYEYLGALQWTIILAGISSMLGLIFSVLHVHYIAGKGISAGKDVWYRRTSIHETYIYLPLIVPQVSFLFGISSIASYIGEDFRYIFLVWCHFLFVLPYIYLVLGGGFKSFDERYTTIAYSLGKGGLRALLRIKLGMLVILLIGSYAVGFAVSVGQYLVNVMIGGGSVVTLTSELVILTSGYERREASVVILLIVIVSVCNFGIVILDMIRRGRIFSYFRLGVMIGRGNVR